MTLKKSLSYLRVSKTKAIWFSFKLSESALNLISPLQKYQGITQTGIETSSGTFRWLAHFKNQPASQPASAQPSLVLRNPIATYVILFRFLSPESNRTNSTKQEPSIDVWVCRWKVGPCTHTEKTCDLFPKCFSSFYPAIVSQGEQKHKSKHFLVTRQDTKRNETKQAPKWFAKRFRKWATGAQLFWNHTPSGATKQYYRHFFFVVFCSFWRASGMGGKKSSKEKSPPPPAP